MDIPLPSTIQKPYMLHLGCGNRRIEGMVNCDYRQTSATDVVMDCTNLQGFENSSARLIFSNAFFEHLYRFQHYQHLLHCYRVLTDKSPLVYLGIPDFEIVARAYLDKSPGLVGPTFDLYHVYRYTHGDPEQVPDWWQEQLHKSVIDKLYVKTLLVEAGFGDVTVFNYRYPQEAIPVCMGVIAWKGNPATRNHEILSRFCEYMDDENELLNVITWKKEE